MEQLFNPLGLSQAWGNKRLPGHTDLLRRIPLARRGFHAVEVIGVEFVEDGIGHRSDVPVRRGRDDLHRRLAGIRIVLHQAEGIGAEGHADDADEVDEEVEDAGAHPSVLQHWARPGAMMVAADAAEWQPTRPGGGVMNAPDAQSLLPFLGGEILAELGGEFGLSEHEMVLPLISVLMCEGRWGRTVVEKFSISKNSVEIYSTRRRGTVKHTIGNALHRANVMCLNCNVGRKYYGQRESV